jgi:4-hydroxy-2-oxoheptanedioate aldolase
MTGKELSIALRSGKKVYGTAVLSSSPWWPKMIAGTGLDFVFLDTEHVPLDRDTLSSMCQAYRALGLPPIVRIPSPDPFIATTALDAGACGVVAPYLERVDQIEALRGATKLRPLKGERLQEVLEGRESLESELLEYIENRNENNLLIVNIESKPALDRLDDLLSVPDIDAVLVGPHDLSCSLGVPEDYDHPKFKEAAKTIIAKSRERNLGVGLHISHSIDEEIGYAQDGANLILHSSDISLVEGTLKNDLNRFRSVLNATEPTAERGAHSSPVI